MLSFLILPMQRVTRLPLLLDVSFHLYLPTQTLSELVFRYCCRSTALCGEDFQFEHMKRLKMQMLAY